MRELLFGAMGCLMLASGTAMADRQLVVLIDATGSMTQTRPSDGRTRFAAAITEAHDRVFTLNNETAGLAGVKVLRFFGAGTVDESGGFISAGDALDIIDALSVTGEVTPLAGSLCKAIDDARGAGVPSDTHMLEVFTDGAENATDPLNACFGPPSITTDAPFDLDSWQNKVYERARLNPQVSMLVGTHLYHDVSNFAARATDPEALLLASRGKRAPAALADGPLTDADFFAALARDTGGTFVEVLDTAPLPVVADLDGDFDVDRNDAISLARKFGAPPFASFDINADGKIGFADYQLLVQRFGNGSGTPAADPYTAGTPVQCFAAGTVTIDGKVIEAGGLTIQAVGACRIIIRNSLIVSGATAVTTLGAADITVDNTIIVGEGGWLNGTGSVRLSAANTVFHGAQHMTGALIYRNRGGNTFE